MSSPRIYLLYFLMLVGQYFLQFFCLFMPFPLLQILNPLSSHSQIRAINLAFQSATTSVLFVIFDLFLICHAYLIQYVKICFIMISFILIFLSAKHYFDIFSLLNCLFLRFFSMH